MDVELHEYLKFEKKPEQTELLEFVQDYLFMLANCSDEEPADTDFNGEIIIDGETIRTEDKAAYVEAVNKLSEADGFTIDISYIGYIDLSYYGLVMYSKLHEYMTKDSFEYKLSSFFPDHGEFLHCKISDGKEVDPYLSLSDDVLDHDFGEEWWSYSLNLATRFDFEKHYDLLTELQKIVRENIPASEVGRCEDFWEQGDLYGLCVEIQFNCMRLREVQDFLDKINEVLLPIKDELEASADGIWVMPKHFGLAAWDWTEEGFKVRGTFY